MMPRKRCDVCNKDLLLGATRYNVEIKLVSGFDGYLPESDDDAGERRSTMEALVENLDAMSEEDLAKEVYQEINLVLCTGCRRHFLEYLSDFTGEDRGSKTKQAHLLQ